MNELAPASLRETTKTRLDVGARVIIGGDHPNRMAVGLLEARAGNGLLVRIARTGQLVTVENRDDVEAINEPVIRRKTTVPVMRRNRIPANGNGCNSVQLPKSYFDPNRPRPTGREAQQSAVDKKAQLVRATEIAAEAGFRFEASDPGALVRLVERRWALRPCFMCGDCGKCRHRELDVEVAEIERDARRMARAASAWDGRGEHGG